MTIVMNEEFDWTQIDDLFLDMDGTLLDLHYDNYFWMEHLPLRLSEIRDCSLDEIKEELHSRYINMRGTLDWYCLEFWQKDLDVDLIAIKREVIHKVQYRPQTKDFLQSISRLEKRVSLVSNSHRLGIDLKFDYLEMHDYFDLVKSSHDYGSPKEQQDFWQKLNKDISFDPERTLFIDDNIDVLNSAKKYGIKHLMAVRQPDLSKPEKAYEGYKQVNRLSDLHPIGESIE